jgi:hypothetical protein
MANRGSGATLPTNPNPGDTFYWTTQSQWMVATPGGEWAPLGAGIGQDISLLSAPTDTNSPTNTIDLTATSGATHLLAIALNNVQTLRFQVSGSGAGTLIVEGQNDGATWSALPGAAVYDETNNVYGSTFTIATGNDYLVNVAGWSNVRLRSQTVGTGTINVGYTLSQSQAIEGAPTPIHGTAATGVTQDTGGVGLIGWISSVLKNLRSLAANLATATVSVPSGAANTVIKGTPGRLIRVVITTAGTTTDATLYDNATTNSGVVLGVIPGTTTDATAVKGKVYTFELPAAAGIVAANTASGPVFTVGYS